MMVTNQNQLPGKKPTEINHVFTLYCIDIHVGLYKYVPISITNQIYLFR